MLLDTPTVDVGWMAPDFTLKDPSGRSITMSEHMGKNGLVIVFICNHCPYVQAIASRLATDAAVLKAEGVETIAVMSNDYRFVPADAPPMMARFAEQHGFPFPYVVDEDQSVGKAFGAVCTPDFFGFNSKGELQYRGRLDSAGMKDPSHRVEELVNAMRLVAETGRGPDEQFPSMGCSIKWR